MLWRVQFSIVGLRRYGAESLFPLRSLNGRASGWSVSTSRSLVTAGIGLGELKSRVYSSSFVRSFIRAVCVFVCLFVWSRLQWVLRGS